MPGFFCDQTLLQKKGDLDRNPVPFKIQYPMKNQFILCIFRTGLFLTGNKELVS
jgi:hypothetical protein